MTTAFRLQRTGHEGAETKRVQMTVKATKQWKSKLSGSKVMVKGWTVRVQVFKSKAIIIQLIKGPEHWQENGLLQFSKEKCS